MDVDLVEVDNSVYEYHLQVNIKILFKLMSKSAHISHFRTRHKQRRQ